MARQYFRCLSFLICLSLGCASNVDAPTISADRECRCIQGDNELSDHLRDAQFDGRSPVVHRQSESDDTWFESPPNPLWALSPRSIAGEFWAPAAIQIEGVGPLPMPLNSTERSVFGASSSSDPVEISLPHAILPTDRPHRFVVTDARRKGHWRLDTHVGPAFVYVYVVTPRPRPKILPPDSRSIIVIAFDVERLSSSEIEDTTSRVNRPTKTLAFNDPDTDGIEFDVMVWRNGELEIVPVVRIRITRVEDGGRRAQYAPVPADHER